ncbi:MAG: GNAT family N-acetyltransferase [Acidobacteriota bacterium]|nr:GNAT family N-acetyltransferase [Acidobacteriota bacterium]
MNVEVVHQIGPLRAEWEALLAASATDTIFASWLWCDTWLRHFGADETPRVVTVRDDQNQLIGIAPLALRTVKTGPLTLQYLQFIGSSAPVEHFDFIIARGREADVLPRILVEIERMPFDVLQLANILPHSPALPLLRESRLALVETDGHSAPVLMLPAQMDDVLARMDKKKSERARYYQRRITRDYPDWQCTVAQPDEIDGALDELIRIHQAQWEPRGVPGAFGDARLTTFYRDLAHELDRRGWLRMYRLIAEGKVVSANFAIVFRNRFMHFINGTDYSTKVQSPGVVLHYCMIERSIAEGVREYDFLWGEEPYKYDWGAERRVDRTMTWERSAPARIVGQARALKEAVKAKLGR